MKIAFDPLPRRSDFFPKTRRGHGSTHPYPRYRGKGADARKLREGCPCVDATCSLLQPKSKNLHQDTGANMKEWCEEHRLSARVIKASPMVAMLYATGGR